jgi:hypothetical protein
MSVLSISEVNSFEVKNPATLEGDATQESIENTHEFQHGLTDATNVLKQKIIKRKPLFSKWRITCGFPGPACRGNHTCGSWMHLILMTLYVGLHLVLLLCFLFNICPIQQLMEPLSVLTLNFHGLLPCQALLSSSPVCILNYSYPVPL